MKRILCVLLVLLLLSGCAKPAPKPETGAPDTAEATEPAPETAETKAPGPETSEPAGEIPVREDAKISDLTADTVLLYRQADFKSRVGTLLPLESFASLPEASLLPRTHVYDDRFPGDAARWLRLLDYAFANEYQGFSVRTRALPALTADQQTALDLIYHIDTGRLCFTDTDGILTAWYLLEQPDAMEQFAVGLEAARRIAAEAPRGDDWETARWIFNYLADHAEYGDRETYYSDHGHHLFDALVENECLCSGYADAMYYLCSLCSVECLEIQGLASPEGPGSTDGHAWNCIRVYGTWYACDPTFNDTAPMPAAVPLCFCLSSAFLETTFGSEAAGVCGDPAWIPACETCFDPVAAWNTTPEGALKSWLWFAAYDAFDPTYLLACGGLATFSTEAAASDGAAEPDPAVSWADYAVWADRFMGGDAARLLPWRFSEGADGRLVIRRAETEGGIDWSGLQIRSVSEAGGVYTADLGPMTAAFTVSQTEDGLYRVETLSLTSNE